jgi:hypothetical protein
MTKIVKHTGRKFLKSKMGGDCGGLESGQIPTAQAGIDGFVSIKSYLMTRTISMGSVVLKTTTGEGKWDDEVCLFFSVHTAYWLRCTFSKL